MRTPLVDQNNFYVSFAGLTIEVHAPSPRTYLYCWDFLFRGEVGEPDISVTLTKEELDHELASVGPLRNEMYYETAMVYRKIVEAAIDFDAFLMHGAVVAVNNEAYMFTAPSGTGKTTHAKMWLAGVDNARMVNGDKPIIRFIDNQAMACGTPWCGKEHIGGNEMVPLKAIVLLQRANENVMSEVSFNKAFPTILSQSHIPTSPNLAKQTVSLISQLQGQVKTYQFFCNNYAKDCLSTSHKALVKKGYSDSQPT